MKWPLRRPGGVKPGDRVILAGVVRAVGPGYLGSDRTDVLVDLDVPEGYPDGATVTLRIEARYFGGAA